MMRARLESDTLQAGCNVGCVVRGACFEQLVSSGDGRSLFWAHLGLVDCLLLCYILLVRSHHLTQHRMGVGYALRVSPAVTRLTVYRRPQVSRRASSVLLESDS